MSEITQILSQIEQGDPSAADELLPLVYDELRKLAAARMARENPGNTLQATALVHDAYVRLAGSQTQKWDSRGHFFAAAAESMRWILIDRARKKRSKKRGGDFRRIDIDSAEFATSAEPAVLLRIDEAISTLAKEDPQAAQIVKLRCFAGLSIEDAAQVMGISTRTGYRHWTYARAWLTSELLD